jgi:hypothetical protein
VRPRVPLIYPLCLVLGALLTTAAALAHPMLAGDGAAQLATIARTRDWAAIHWGFLFAFPLSITGLSGVVGATVGTPGAGATRAGLAVGVFAYACWMIIVAFMLGGGGALADVAARERVAPDVAATQAVFLFDMLRPFALAAQRAGGFSLGLATSLLGWGVWCAGWEVLPRWTAVLAIAGGTAGAALALAAPASSLLDQAAYGPPVLWQLLVGLVLLRAPRPS